MPIGAYTAASLPLMPRRKRPPSLEVTEVPSIGGVEVISVDIVAGKTIKKRTFEKVLFDIPALNDSSPPPDDDTSNITTTTVNPKGPSRSSSVCIYFPGPLRC